MEPSLTTLAPTITLRDQALSVIRQSVVLGHFKPGAVYSAAAIATQLGVSASPVREAMLTLVNQGLVEPVRNRGYRVLPLDSKERDDICQIRIMLEIPAVVGLAGNQEVIGRYDELRRIVDKMAEAGRNGDLVGFLDFDREFHVELLKHCRNGRLLKLIDELRDQTRSYRLHDLANRETLTRSTAEHLAILDAIVADDADKLRELLDSHFEDVKRPF